MPDGGARLAGWLRGTALAISLALLPALAFSGPSAFAEGPADVAGASVRMADFQAESPSADAREVADWVVRAADNRGLPFIVIDKVQARVYVFHAEGRLRGASPALLGLAIGDDTAAGIGERSLASIRPEERTTPAGRFMASLDRDISGVEVLWVDYDSALSLHRIVPGTPKERRASRIASTRPADRRITYGCVNVPVRFYEDVVSPAFKGTYGVVYVLPETRRGSLLSRFVSAS